jgi:hypothetical protein
MTDKKDGGAAFPRTLQYFPDDTNYDEETGMTLRDWFAGQALAGLAAAKAQITDEGAGITWAEGAYSLADQMIAEREKGGDDAE